MIAADAPISGVHVGSAAISVSTGNRHEPLTPRICPPAALLPLVHGERLDPAPSDLHDPRGSGLPWPPAAQFEGGKQPARLPAAIAWQLLTSHEDWQWERGKGQPPARCTGAEAIATVVRGAVLPEANPAARLPVAVAIPNHLTMQQQDRLLRAARLEGLDPLLVWRPIAAAVAWIERNQHLLQGDHTHNLPIGKLLWVHLGLEIFECDILEVVPYLHDGRHWLLPARHRPRFEAPQARALHALESALLESRDLSTAWRQLWTTTFLTHPFATDPSLSQGFSRHLRQPRTDTPLARLRGSASPGDLHAWLQPALEELRAPPPLGVVLTGELVAQPAFGRLAEALFPDLFRLVSPDRLLLDAHAPDQMLADGSHEILRRRLADEPTYLDTLPLLEALVIRRGEGHWQNLVETGDRYVLGARDHEFTPDALHLSIPPETKEFTLEVFHENFETVRHVAEAFPRHINEAIDVQLKIRMASAQGYPSVEVVPASAAKAFATSLFLDWATAEDTGKSREQVLEDLPRTNPRCEPRQPSRRCWTGHGQPVGARSQAEQFVRAAAAKRRMTQQSVKNLVDALRSSDKTMSSRHPPIHATCFGCTGTLASPEPLAESLVHALDERIGRNDPNEDLIIRALGYCSARTPRVMELVTSAVGFETVVSGERLRALLVVMGNSITTPEEAADFGRFMVRYAKLQQGQRVDWLKALYRVLMYREDSTRDLSNDACYHLSKYALQAMKNNIAATNKAAYIYAYGTLAIAYLLRRRRYDDSYMAPDLPLALETKEYLVQCKRQMESGSLDYISGVIDLPHVTQLIIDYIDRRGRGRLVLMD